MNNIKSEILLEDFKTEMRKHWEEVKGNLRKLGSSLSPCPMEFDHIFKFPQGKTDNEVSVQINPIAFQLPWDAGSNKEIIAVVGGNITFEKVDIGPTSYLRSTDYGTRVEIYRKYHNQQMDHIFGALYHFEKSIDHPIFHGHITNEMDLIEYINEKHMEYTNEKKQGKHVSSFPYRLISELTQNFSGQSKISGTPRSVKIPTAQMDVFSVIIQLCADHLLSEENRDGKKDDFEKLRESCSFFQSCENGFGNQNHTIPNTVCLRSGRWYSV